MDPQSALLITRPNLTSPRGISRDGGGAVGRSPHPALRRGILTRTVELDLIPGLLAGRRPPAAGVTAAQVAELTDLTLLPAESAVFAFVRDLHARGIGAEALYLDLLTAAARRLGDLWVEDICDFTQVTVGLWRLQSAMRTLEPAFLAATRPAPRQAVGRAFLVPLPGEQHTFGLSMVQGFFRRAGWSVWSGPVASRGELATMVRSESVDVLGFSLACDERLDVARAEITAVRAASRNPEIAVMVGGPPFVADPALAAAVGADGTALDGLQAVAEAGALLRRAAGRRNLLRRGS